MKNIFVLVAATLSLVSIDTTAQNAAPDPAALINAATAAMGTAKLRSLQYTATGSFGATRSSHSHAARRPKTSTRT